LTAWWEITGGKKLGQQLQTGDAEPPREPEPVDFVLK
jgi:hypothetical protein